jgi:hypothetical protein
MQPNDQAFQKQIELAKNLLRTVRHAAYSTVNADNTPHNSPLMLMYNENLSKLYVGSYSESQHCKNLIQTGKAFVVLYDSITKGQGGIYITGSNAHECTDDELIEALRVHNTFRVKHGDQPIDISYYLAAKPSQRMYSIDITKIETYSVVYGDDGLIIREARVKVNAETLLENMA